MASGIVNKPIYKVYQKRVTYTGISGSAHTNITLTTDLSGDLDIASPEFIIGNQLISDSNMDGAVYDLFRNSNTVYIKSDTDLKNGTVNVYWFVWA